MPAALLFLLLLAGSHHTLTKADQRVEASWRQAKRISQRQLDLVAELSTLVKESLPVLAKPLQRLNTSHGRLLKRQMALTAPVTQDKLREYEKSYSEMTSDLKRIVRTGSSIQPFENSRSFQEWMGHYQGTEHLLALEKQRYNRLATAYNRIYETFFVNWVAERFELQSRPLWKEEIRKARDGSSAQHNTVPSDRMEGHFSD